LWVSPLWWLALSIVPFSLFHTAVVSTAACALAPLPALLVLRRSRRRLLLQAREAREESEKLKLQLENVRYRTARLREELSAADRQARLSHQLTLLGQFTAGFLHEYNNPLAIVTNRIEVLLEERKDDDALCADLRQMLNETHYMANIAGTLLRALRRERGGETFEASVPAEVLREVVAALEPSAAQRGVRLLLETADVPRVNLPGHVISEVVRALISNALQALDGRGGASILVRLEPFRAGASKVALRVEDNGPGVPDSLREHLFEPFVSQSAGRERLGLGLFLSASLLNTYDGSLRYESRDGGGASFVVELPPARFTRGQPYHWFVRGGAE
jgi:two-component system C4-dicarboxylate transport sensor histidine kinase DctB